MQILQVQNGDVMAPSLVDQRAKSELGTGFRPSRFGHKIFGTPSTRVLAGMARAGLSGEDLEVGRL
jgi:hypothetical protein